MDAPGTPASHRALKMAKRERKQTRANGKPDPAKERRVRFEKHIEDGGRTRPAQKLGPGQW